MAILGDLEERFQDHCARRGRVQAIGWFWAEAVALAARFRAERDPAAPIRVCRTDRR